jgi:hypothetical protein
MTVFFFKKIQLLNNRSITTAAPAGSNEKGLALAASDNSNEHIPENKRCVRSYTYFNLYLNM